MTIVQICGCIVDDDDDVTPFVSNQRAEFYGVYVSMPNGLYEHVVDHVSVGDAREAANASIAKGLADWLDDKTFDEEN